MVKVYVAEEDTVLEVHMEDTFHVVEEYILMMVYMMDIVDMVKVHMEVCADHIVEVAVMLEVHILEVKVRMEYVLVMVFMMDMKVHGQRVYFGTKDSGYDKKDMIKELVLIKKLITESKMGEKMVDIERVLVENLLASCVMFSKSSNSLFIII